MLSEIKKHKLKKILKELGSIRGRHTELVTVYIPQGYPLSEIINQIRSEQGTAENIKSKQVRKNVVSALEKILRHLQLYNKTPENGLAIFCGNVSQEEGKTDIKLWAIEPPEPIKVKLYWCDQVFRLEPLEEFIKEKEVYGIVCLDKSEADIALLIGKKINVISHQESIVPGKTRAGGQSSARFSRVREGLKHDWLKSIAEIAERTFSQEKDLIGIIISGPGPIKEEFAKGDYLRTDLKNKIIGIVDTGYTGEYGLEETIERAKDIISEASVTKEKNLLKEFFTLLQKGEGVTYGREETMKALRAGALKILLLSESLEDESIEEECKNYGTELKIISEDTREGQQFKELCGIGGILRYKLNF
jgi:peptide chain release factor subunit 1